MDKQALIDSIDYKLYKDIGISGKDKDRPAFQKMTDDVETGRVNSVVVTKLDRITRSLKDLIYLKELFDEYDVSFVSITQNLDTSTPMGRFSFFVLGLVAQLEREVTAERVAEDMKTRAKRKKWKDCQNTPKPPTLPITTMCSYGINGPLSFHSSS